MKKIFTLPFIVLMSALCFLLLIPCGFFSSVSWVFRAIAFVLAGWIQYLLTLIAPEGLDEC